MFRCQNCGLSESAPLYSRVPDRLAGKGDGFDYVRCGSCGLVQIAEVPANLAEHYDGYRVHGQDSFVYRAVRQLLIGHCYPVSAGSGALLDFGCGNGWFIKEMAARGWQAHGYEADAAYAARLGEALGLPVLSGHEALRARAGTFDRVTFNFSFEHLDRPHEALTLAAACLKPGGSIYLCVPNIEGREARLFKEHWFHLDPPRHISFFSKRMLSRALEEHGFDGVEVKDLAVPTGFAGSLSYRLFGRFHPLPWYGTMLPGMLFSLFVRDGNFAVTATKV
jgi:SAM-dependent methyltransferase